MIISHSEDKGGATGTWKGTFGHHPLFAFLDYGAKATGELLAFLQRTGSAGSNTAKDHTRLSALAVRALPSDHPRGKKTCSGLIRPGAPTSIFLGW